MNQKHVDYMYSYFKWGKGTWKIHLFNAKSKCLKNSLWCFQKTNHFHSVSSLTSMYLYNAYLALNPN